VDIVYKMNFCIKTRITKMWALEWVLSIGFIGINARCSILYTTLRMCQKKEKAEKLNKNPTHLKKQSLLRGSLGLTWDENTSFLIKKLFTNAIWTLLLSCVMTWTKSFLLQNQPIEIKIQKTLYGCQDFNNIYRVSLLYIAILNGSQKNSLHLILNISDKQK
jgi:hypothetical protein